MINKKTFSIVALYAILIGSMMPNLAFALTPAEELEQARSVTGINPNAQLPVDVASPSTHIPGHVSVELQLLVDVSGSVDDTEFALQRDGIAAVFGSQAFKDKVKACGNAIATQLVYWSGEAEQSVAVDWTLIASDGDADAFAAAVTAAPRPFAGLTAPGSAIAFGTPLFTNAFTSDRQVMDVSGDGVENDGLDTSTARDAALAAGIDVINGIVIGGDPAVLAFYTTEVIGGTGSFVSTAADFTEFGAAIDDKIKREICEPVGGQFLEINASSLFVAGLAANAIWIVPAIAGIVGTGIYFIGSRKDTDEI